MREHVPDSTSPAGEPLVLSEASQAVLQRLRRRKAAGEGEGDG